MLKVLQKSEIESTTNKETKLKERVSTFSIEHEKARIRNFDFYR